MEDKFNKGDIQEAYDYLDSKKISIPSTVDGICNLANKTRDEENQNVSIKKGSKYFKQVQSLGLLLFVFAIVDYFFLSFFTGLFFLAAGSLYVIGTILGTEITIESESETK